MSVSTRPATDGQYRLTVEQFDRMCAAGILPEGRHVELLSGRLYAVTRGQPHTITVIRLANLFRALAPAGCYISEEKPARQGRHWKPEPDVGVVRGHPEDYPVDPPALDRFALLIEVAETSCGTDAGIKLRKYALVGVPVYWIVDLARRRVEVHRHPSERGKGASYKQVTCFDPGEVIAVEIDGREVGRIAVSDILPPG